MFGFILDNVTFAGRASRLDFWLVFLFGPLLMLIIGIPLTMIAGLAGLVLLVLMSILLWAGVVVRRLRAKDMNLHWAWLFLLAPVVLAWGGEDMTGPAAIAATVAGGALTLWTVVELGIIPGPAE